MFLWKWHPFSHNVNFGQKHPKFFSYFHWSSFLCLYESRFWSVLETKATFIFHRLKTFIFIGFETRLWTFKAKNCFLNDHAILLFSEKLPRVARKFTCLNKRWHKTSDAIFLKLLTIIGIVRLQASENNTFDRNKLNPLQHRASQRS
jgi:hypothetical protein